MKKYRVHMQRIIDIAIEVEAKNEEDAIEKAYQDSYIRGYAGNGGMGDKLIGTDSPNVTIDCEGEVLDGAITFAPEAEEIEEE